MFHPNFKAVMLNSRARKNADKVLHALNLKSGNVVADIGSGGGYFTVLLSKSVAPDGIVYAVDVSESLLRHVEQEAAAHGCGNVKTILAENSDSKLPADSCDLIFMRNVFHHLTNPSSYFQNLRANLKPGGRIALLDWKPGAEAMPGRHHVTPEATIFETMSQTGYTHIESFDFLSDQTFNIFQKQA